MAATEADAAAFESFVRAHHRSLERIAYALTGDHAEAEDVVAGALTAAWTHWDQVRAASRTPVYVRGAVVSLAAARARRRARPLAPLTPWRRGRPGRDAAGAASGGTTDAGTPADAGTPGTSADAATSVAPAASGEPDAPDLRTALLALPERARACVVLRYVAALEPVEVAEILGIGEGAVRVQTAKGLDELRRALGDPPSRPSPARPAAGRTPDPQVTGLLGTYGAYHDPDTDHLWIRVDPARPDGGDAPATAPPPHALRTGAAGVTGVAALAGRRPRRPLVVAALMILGLIGAVMAAQAVSDTGAEPPAAAALPSPGPTAPAAPTASTPPPVVGTATATRTPPATRTPSAVPTTTRPPSARPTPTPTGGSADGIRIVAAERDLRVETPDELDWIVVGGRRDDATVRASRPVDGRALELDAPRDAVRSGMPGTVTWDDGDPEEDRTVDDWLAADGGSWVVFVGPADRDRVLVVRAGLASRVRVEADGENWQSERIANPPGAELYDVRVGIPERAGRVTVTVTAVDGPLAVSTVSLRAG